VEVSIPSVAMLNDSDFNSTPSGMTYTALTQRPIELTTYQQDELNQSLNYDFQHVKDEDEEPADEGEITSTETITPIDRETSSSNSKSDISASEPHWKSEEHSKQALLESEEKPLNITPATISNNDLVLAHHRSNPPLQSLYSSGLNLVQPDNAINAFGEPPFTNWAHGYKETLDYIFVLRGNQNIRLTGLLKMPRRDEMGEGEPQEGRFPSDHVCEMVEVQLS
jgi:RNA exonuclease NGL2